MKSVTDGGYTEKNEVLVENTLIRLELFHYYETIDLARAYELLIYGEFFHTKLIHVFDLIYLLKFRLVKTETAVISHKKFRLSDIV